MSTQGKPVPAITPAMEPFWAATKEGRLVVQRCSGCGVLRFPARSHCSTCLDRGSEWVPVSGRGTVFSVVVMHQASHPAFAAETPYAIVTIELAEGVRMLSGIIDIPAAEVTIGTPVEVAFEERGDGVFLPMFRPHGA